MKILNKILIGSLSLLCLSSCDFLDETAYNKVTVGNFYTMSNGIIGRLMRQMLMSGVSGIVVINP